MAKDEPTSAAHELGAENVATALVSPRPTPDAPFRAKRPEGDVEKAFAIPTAKRFKLKTGADVVLIEDHRLPLVSATMVIKSGSAANPKGKAGLAALMANMLDEGTKSRSALQIDDEISFLGATLNTAATWDATIVEMSTLADKLDAAWAVWADVVLNPAFDDKELTRLRENLLTSLSRRKDSPPAVAALTFARTVYGDDHPMGWPEVGVETSLKDISAADLRAFHDSSFRPGNAVIVLAGDITEATARTKLDPLFAAWKPKPVPPLKVSTVPGLGKTRVVLVDKEGAPQSSITLGLPGINRKNPDYYKALVMNHLLGGSFKRLFMLLREQKGWTYGVVSRFEAGRSAGPWAVRGEFVAKHTVDAVAEILREIKDLKDEKMPLTDKELSETKAELIKAFPARFSTVNQVANQFAGLEILGLPRNEFATYTKKLAAVTRDDIRKMAQKYLLAEHFAIVVVGDRKSHEGGLKQIADVELRDLDGAVLAK